LSEFYIFTTELPRVFVNHQEIVWQCAIVDCRILLLSKHDLSLFMSNLQVSPVSHKNCTCKLVKRVLLFHLISVENCTKI